MKHINLVYFSPFQSNLIQFGPFDLLRSLLSILVQFGPLRSFRSIWSLLGHMLNMLCTYVIELANPLTKRTLLVIV